VRDPALVERLVAEDAERLVVALDARDGVVRTDGWTASAGVRVLDLALQMAAFGVRRFLYTDIGRDGALSGPNLEAYRQLVATVDAAVLASGGVARIEDIAALMQTGVEGVIVGRALYTGDLRLAEALAVVRGTAR
jgi:phosphoribosylformimino-5-aminoimidazole carboxamide ribotide isomerase